MKEVVITTALRTPVGKAGGSFKDIPAEKLAALVLKEIANKSSIDPELIDEVYIGCRGQETVSNMARYAALEAGLPISVSAMTIQRTCGSGLQAIASATQAIQTENGDIIVAGGTENMTRWPYVMLKAPAAYHKALPTFVTSPTTPPRFEGSNMGITAENLQKKYNISRKEQEEFAYLSHMKAWEATKNGKFKDEIIPMQIPQKKGEPVTFDTDEIIRPGTSLEQLAKLKPAYVPDGTVTAGTSSPISDGAAAVIVMSKEMALKLGMEPLATIRSYAAVGLDPSVMGLGPVYAIPKALKKAGLTLDQIDLIELNEAFAAQFLACDREMDFNKDILNVNGGAIALGHPIGCSGTKITVTLLHEMKKRNAKYGLVSLCCGGGQGVAMVVER